jgi:NAD(P)H dehydrogenase (quinone)
VAFLPSLLSSIHLCYSVRFHFLRLSPRHSHSQETLSKEILGKMYAGQSLEPKYPIIKPEDLKELDVSRAGFPSRTGSGVDGSSLPTLSPALPLSSSRPLDPLPLVYRTQGFLLGFPTRYGRTPAQVSAFFDATGGLWASGALIGKFGAIFTSTASQHGGQETTALTTIPFFAHHGILFVPLYVPRPWR